MKRYLFVLVLFIGVLLHGKEGIRLELIGEKAMDEDVLIQMGMAEGKRIVWDKNTTDKESNVLFVNKEGEVIKRLKIPPYTWSKYVRFSENGLYVGVGWVSMDVLKWAGEDSFVLYDSLGRRIWSIRRKEDTGTIFHSRNGLSGFIPGHGDIYISPMGDRVACVEGFDCSNFSPNDTFRIDFYGGHGEIIKRVKLPHTYYWQAGWSPDGEMFVISVPGRNPYGISRDDMIYAFDKDGNLKWSKKFEGLHFIPVQDAWRKTMVLSDKYIIQAYYYGMVVLSYDGKYVKKLRLRGTGFDLKLSPDNQQLLAWCFEHINIVNLNDFSVYSWTWEGRKSPHITDVSFLDKDRVVAMVKIYDKKRLGKSVPEDEQSDGEVIILERNKGIVEGEWVKIGYFSSPDVKIGKGMIYIMRSNRCKAIKIRITKEGQ